MYDRSLLLLKKGGVKIYDRFLVLLKNGRTEYRYSIYDLVSDSNIVEILTQERTFDSGKTFIEVIL